MFVFFQEPAYTPQVEAISPTLPSEEGRCESPMRVMKENILNNINRVDKEINQLESQLSKLHKKMVSTYKSLILCFSEICFHAFEILKTKLITK